ncbi:thermonuclease family protein [Paenactinomyces guangxiensis]|uniref:Thermonuclease family protein n=1 Tax=Paenactinomyces guangxiensis TaxID=1490290 RepID=A0A7W1WP25_9BACL|nr:thermonuclease family protein [Paenactinomyces guangxiensis]MBA4493437.1 thermonuclease family protein [Paenactinomyces guangxiensis]MBH8590528.1 thermonuclease family protein [Paenactinomyces guangxiensis]
MVRFWLIETPETKHPELGEQPLGKEASAFMKKMLTEASRYPWNLMWRSGINMKGYGLCVCRRKSWLAGLRLHRLSDLIGD